MEKKKILFVCLGNICRSPSAEAVMKALVEKKELSHLFEIDSAGTIGYHAGEPADSRMMRHAIKRGYKLTSISRPVQSDFDFGYFDKIIGMDDQNVRDLYAMCPDLSNRSKIFKMTNYCSASKHTSVPDPYYGGEVGFEVVLDILEDACGGLLNQLQADDHII